MWKELSMASPYLLRFFPKVNGVAEYSEYKAKCPATLQLNYIAAVKMCSPLLLRINQYVAKNMGLICRSFIHFELVLQALCNTKSCSCGLGGPLHVGSSMCYKATKHWGSPWSPGPVFSSRPWEHPLCGAFASIWSS